MRTISMFGEVRPHMAPHWFIKHVAYLRHQRYQMCTLPRDVTIFYDSTPFNVPSKDFFCIIFASVRIKKNHPSKVSLRIFKVSELSFIIKLSSINWVKRYDALEAPSRIGNQSKSRHTSMYKYVATPIIRVPSGTNERTLIWRIAVCFT